MYIANHLDCNCFNKAIFAPEWRRENQHRLDPAEQAAVHKYVPWSRLVADDPPATTERRWNWSILIRARKDELVLKPVREYGARRCAALGTDAPTWERALRGRWPRPSGAAPGSYAPGNFSSLAGALHLQHMVNLTFSVWRGGNVRWCTSGYECALDERAAAGGGAIFGETQGAVSSYQ